MTMYNSLSRAGAVAARCPEEPDAVAPERFASIIDAHVILRRAGRVLLLRRTGDVYVFSGGPGGQITLNPRVCPAQKADVSSSNGATGVVQATLDPEQRCVAAAVILYA